MEEAGPHQAATGPHQVDANLHQAESRGFQYSNPCKNLKRIGGREGSVHTTHTNKSQSREKSRVSHAKDDRDMQCEIDELKRELHHTRRRHSPPSSELSSEETDGAVIDEDSELRPARLSPMTRSTTIDIDIRARLAKV